MNRFIAETGHQSTNDITYHSHTRRLLSSDVDTNRRFWSTNVMVLTAPRCRSYSCTISPDLISHCNKFTHYIQSFTGALSWWPTIYSLLLVVIIITND